jgi:hypothetical protein
MAGDPVTEAERWHMESATTSTGGARADNRVLGVHPGSGVSS